ncbi:thiaminase II [Priestia filamentosa]|uniref:Aminopyrimidine aminohydrolase n=1 Tax=Priestia filamentosa TaxID=1402861 RepID=A0A1X7G4S6_9BACI|nr:thiaminase II [Priestia filamentosa]AKO91874.1 thiaminase II [Priestia filamentosa]MDT3762024.1 thiaminase II [Priestia filamentosa]OXS65989.1 thiaminase II [Priestia filamentosa]RJS64690.1 thiaminase II [Priestia filamentosa]WRU96524.1 thiaminase II [Priestia filamentosa]
MSFSQELRRLAAPVYEAIFNHPFVKGIGEGNVPKDALIHYVCQDFEYLTSFCRVYGVAISRCENREQMELFNEQINFVLHSEVHPHHNFCDVAGVKYEDLQAKPLAPGAHHYINHMTTVAQTGSLGEIIAVLLPCPWTYLEIGQKLIEQHDPTEDHPFYEWIMFYGKKEMDSVTHKLCALLDQWAEGASEREKEKMKDHFIKSCELEYLFWDMAYQKQQWPSEMSPVEA